VSEERPRHAVVTVWWERDEGESFRRILRGEASSRDFVCAYRIRGEDVDELEKALKELHGRTRA
jgi:anthranilate phosphoribosyltransferase